VSYEKGAPTDLYNLGLEGYSAGTTNPYNLGAAMPFVSPSVEEGLRQAESRVRGAGFPMWLIPAGISLLMLLLSKPKRGRRG
jgi:hypothetical protein